MWFVLALLAGLLFAANKLIFRAVFQRGASPLPFLAPHEVMAGLLLVPFALWHVALPHDVKTWAALAGGVLLYLLGGLFRGLGAG